MKLCSAVAAIPVLFASPFAFGQSSSSPVDTGLQAYHDYHGGEIDHINLDSGRLTLTLPLVSYPQRGSALKADFGIVYDSGGLVEAQSCVTIPGKGQQCSLKWMLSGAVPSVNSFTPLANSGQFALGPGLYDLQDLVYNEKGLPLAGPVRQRNTSIKSLGTLQTAGRTQVGRRVQAKLPWIAQILEQTSQNKPGPPPVRQTSLVHGHVPHLLSFRPPTWLQLMAA